MKTVYRVYDGPRHYDFGKDTIDKMKDLGLIRFYGVTRDTCMVMNYRPAPRSRAVRARSW